jgi:hypothetical protein
MDIIKKINLIAEQYFDGNNVAFAKKFGTSEANIRNYRTKIVPRVDFLVQVCNEFEISFEWMFNDVEPIKRLKNSNDNLENPKIHELLTNYRKRIDALYKVVENQEQAIKMYEDLTLGS